MGWDYVRGKTRDWLVNDCIKDSDWAIDDHRRCTRKTLAYRLVFQRGHCSGDPSHVLWSVKHDVVTNALGIVLEESKYILCTLIQKCQGEWGQKDMTESCHPYWYDCPLEFLDLAPVACQQWRDIVQNQHVLCAV